MTLKEYIFREFTRNGTGKNKPIKRNVLLRRIKLFFFTEFSVSDREMRVAYEGLAVCSSRDGLYLLKTEDERREQVALRMKLIFAHFRKIKILREYKIDSDSVQKNLF